MPGSEYQLFWQDRRDLDGCAIELIRRSTDTEKLVAEVFCADHSSTLFLTLYEERIPIDAVERMIARAKAELPES